MSQRELTFLHGRHTPHCDAWIDKHFEGYCSLQYMPRGRLYLRYDNREHILRGPWFWPCYPGPRIVFHAAPPTTEWEHYYVAFQGTLAEQWRAEGLIGEGPQQPTGLARPAERFAELIRLAGAADDLSQRRARNMLEGLLLELLAGRTETTRRREGWLQQAIDVLSSPKTYPVDYDALAEQLGMATSTLRRKFRDATGQSPHHYALAARMSEARRLLLETALPVKAIAEQLGFSDVHFFTRQFGQFVGVPPAMFRRNLKS